jgi:hypothetical protein
MADYESYRRDNHKKPHEKNRRFGRDGRDQLPVPFLFEAKASALSLDQADV